MKTDIEIAQETKLENIEKIAKKLNIKKDDLCLFGEKIAKINNFQNYIKNAKKQGKLILVTAMSPTKFGIGKTTVSIGLADAFRQLGKKSCLALREPSLGPVFGVKGGAAGGGYSQVLPMEEINLNFTGDFDSITAANNLLCAMIDNHIFSGNELDIDEKQILFHRALDVNDRSLREINYSIISKDKNGEKLEIKRKDNFSITAASEIMAICCLAQSLDELKERLGNIMIAISKNGKPIFARDIHAEGAMSVILRNVLKPNLVQTIEGTPAFVHLGPFANIAHGCNSIIATKLALSTSDYVVTEAGFGSDLGAEKFIDLKCRLANLSPSAVVLVATIRGLKFHGESDLNKNNEINKLELGLENLYHHIETLKNTFNMNVIVTINKFISDSKKELSFVIDKLKERNTNAVINECYEFGGKGTIDLAKVVLSELNSQKATYSYNLEDKIEKKIEDITKNVYGGKGVKFTKVAKDKITQIEKFGYSKLPIIIAKTQFSLSDDKNLIGRPKDFILTITDVELKSGAGFIVAIAGNMMLMPGLSKKPNAENINIVSNKIVGLS